MTNPSTQQGDDESRSRASDSEDSSAEASEDVETEASAEELRTRVNDLEDTIEELEKEREELNDRLLRKAAEFDNYRRRMEREKKRRYRSGRVDVIRPVLEVVDDFERSLEATEDLDATEDAEAAYESLKGGVEMVFRKFLDTLETLGVEPIEAEGRPFDEALHEAMMRQPTDEAAPGTVLHEVRKGYRMDDHVVRHSRVVVAAESSDQTDNGGAEKSQTYEDEA